MRKFLFTVLCLLGTSQFIQAQCSTASTPGNNCASFGDQIDSFVLNGQSSPNSSGCSTGGYGAYNTTWLLLPGQTYTFSASVGNNVYNQSFGIWIDFNNDGQYVPLENVYLGGAALTHNGSFTVPGNAAITGTMRMRIRNTFGSFTINDMCTANINSYGETEDYYVSTSCPSAATVNVAASNTFICVGQSTTFSVNAMTSSSFAANSFTWVGNGTGSVITVTPSSTTVYTVVAGYNGCSTSTFTALRTISVTNVPLPIAVVATNTTICANTTASLNATGATNYTWLPGSQTGFSAVVSPTANTIFTVVGYSGVGCPGTATVGIQVNPAPVIAMSLSSGTLCPGQSVTITATGANTYTWNNNSNNTGSSFVMTPSVTSLIQVVGASSIGCTAGNNTVVIVQQAPNVIATTPQTLVCAGETVTLTASGAATYSWNNNATGNTAVYTPTGLTQVIVMGIATGSFCPGQYTVMLNTTQPTVVAVASPSAICIGKTATLNATGADNYTFSSVFNTVTPTVTTIYTVTGEGMVDNLICVDETTVQVVVNANPTVTAVPDRTVMCRNETVTLTANGAVSYLWSGSATGTTQIIEMKPVVAQTLSFTVKGTDANGCVANGTLTVKVNACTGVDETEWNGIQLYPNPSYGEMHVKSEQPLRLILMDVTGKVVYEVGIEAGSTKIDLSHLSNGVYMVVGDGQGRQLREKVIIAH